MIGVEEGSAGRLGGEAEERRCRQQRSRHALNLFCRFYFTNGLRSLEVFIGSEILSKIC